VAGGETATVVDIKRYSPHFDTDGYLILAFPGRAIENVRRGEIATLQVKKNVSISMNPIIHCDESKQNKERV
jgi:hypothetical protein